MFTTESNLELLDKNSDWLSDGTFDIAPSFLDKFILYMFSSSSAHFQWSTFYYRINSKKLIGNLTFGSV